MKFPLTRAQLTAQASAQPAAAEPASANATKSTAKAAKATNASPALFSQPAIPAPYPNFNFDFLMTADKTPILSSLNTFSNLDEYRQEIQNIGQPSANGFIRKLKYQAGYDAVLKSSMEDDTDSLVYEYLVGQCINYFSTYYPCFSYTYAACNYKNQALWEQMKDKPKDQKVMGPLSNYIEIMNTRDVNAFIETGCANNKISCILTQYVPMNGDLTDYISSYSHRLDPNLDQKIEKYKLDQLKKACRDAHLQFNPKARKADLKQLLSNNNRFVFPASHRNELNKITLFFHMTYSLLNSFKDMLTHYDLHTGNVSVVPVPEGKAITIVYFAKGKEVLRYKSAIIPVVIDYGRCFVNCAATNSFEVLKSVCAMDSSHGGPCADSCGNERGYGFSSPYNSANNTFAESDVDNYFINYTKKNNSSDLRFIKYFSNQVDFSQVADHPLIQLMSRIVGAQTEYSVFPEMASVRGSQEINNITDALNQLTQTIKTPGFTSGFEGYVDYGRLDIHTDLSAPFRFVKA